ncbi:SDR family NAD(P)-dependent oxidoreductase [Nocardia otitidiscaviarum]|uniref:SDR family NAD(P)-dependent oxidoreductase n=1 Tax=Nocardia otitidiscaviarum TaxID=1823 RepID=UPI002B4B5CEC|nr:SDR family NAD(P)-dependent oxidoreductase [Nocardia otitidiscaviarum]
MVLSDVEEDALAATTAELRAAGGDVHGIVTDVSNPDKVAALAAATLERYGAVHILCNNAGVAGGGVPSWASTLDDWAWVLGVNLMGVVHGHRSFLPIMIEQDEEAHIVNTASVAGVAGGSSVYGATKSAVIALSETVHMELADVGPSSLPPEVSMDDLRQMFAHGTSPRVVADQVLRAIREERLYVLTHPEWKGHIEHRMQAILNGENLTPLPPP